MRSSLLALCLVVPASAQDRAERVRNDLQQIVEAGQWLYDELDKGFAAAKESGKPMLVVLRCIPCEACRGFDEQVAQLDPRLRALLERFVRVRIPKANGLDLSLFQVDWDLSFQAVFLHADRTIYGRFGSRSTQEDKTGDVSVPAFREAMEAVLDLHARHAEVKDALRNKMGPAPRFATPEKYPTLAKYQPSLDYAGKVVQSCIHCHQLREAERSWFRGRREPIPERVLFAWPSAEVVGIELDPRRRAHVARVAAGSAAEKAGLRAGDDLSSLAGQPLVSIADFEWVLENAPDRGTLPAVARREGKEVRAELTLAAGWRRKTDISWRSSSWDLRRMGLGGMFLVEAGDAERKALDLAADRMALYAKHVGEHGEHATALRAGVKKGDFVVAVDGKTERRTESELLAYALQKQAGERIEFTIRRGKEERTVGFAVR